MRTIPGLVATGALLLAGAANAQPPLLGQEEAREAAVRHDHGAPYVDLSVCSEIDRAAQELTQLDAAWRLPASDRGAAVSGGACRVETIRPAVAKVDDRLRR